MLYETSIFESLVELVYVFSITERTRTHNGIAPGASPVLTTYLDDGIFGQRPARVFSCRYTVVLGEGIQMCVGEFVDRYEA